MIVGIVLKESNEKPKITKEKTAQKIPARTTVVNFGVSFLHLKETEKTEKPVAEIKPNSKPRKDPSLVLPKAIIIMPIAVIIIESIGSASMIKIVI